MIVNIAWLAVVFLVSVALGWAQGSRRALLRRLEEQQRQAPDNERQQRFHWEGMKEPGPRMRKDIEEQLHRTAIGMFMSGKSREEILATIQPVASMNYPGCKVRISTFGGRLRFAYVIPRGE